MMSIIGDPRTESVNPYSARIDFRRQNLTFVDVRFWRLKSILAVRIKIFIMAADS